MNYSSKIYNKDEILKEFNDTFKDLDINSRAVVSKLLSIEKKIKRESEALKQELLSDLKKEDSNERFNLAVISYIDGDLINKDYRLISQATAVLHEYAKKTLEYMREKHFKVTLKEFSEMLDINERYISRNLLDYIDYFKMKTVARHVLKEYDMKFDRYYINKEVFISVKSIRAFIKKYLKFSSKKVQIDLTMPEDKKDELDKKFKGDKAFRAAIMKVISILEEKHTDVNYKVNRLELPLYTLKDEAIEDIINFKTELKSIETIIKDSKSLERIEYELENKEYSYKSLSSKSVYDMLDNNIATIRFVLDGLNDEKQVEVDRQSLLDKLIEELESKNISENNGQFTVNKEDLLNLFNIDKKLFSDIKDSFNGANGAKVQKRFIARYSVSTKDLINFRQIESKDNYLYAIEESAYKAIIKDLKGDNERREAVINCFYDEMMKDEFKVYERVKKGD